MSSQDLQGSSGGRGYQPYDLSQRQQRPSQDSADRVKRPMNPFLLFCQKRRGELMKGQPGMKPSDISKQLGEVWKGMTDEDKKPYIDEAHKLKADFEKNHPDYKFQPKRKPKSAKSVESKTSNASQSSAPATPSSSITVPAASQAYQYYPNLATRPAQSFATSAAMLPMTQTPYGAFNFAYQPPTTAAQNAGAAPATSIADPATTTANLPFYY
ncbi:unnamed protein product [Caenorhabditis nigoni]